MEKGEWRRENGEGRREKGEGIKGTFGGARNSFSASRRGYICTQKNLACRRDFGRTIKRNLTARSCCMVSSENEWERAATKQCGRENCPKNYK
jgi:hypothetical protein